MIKTISKITLYVENQADAKGFWVDKVGFVVTREVPMGPEMVWLEVSPSATATTAFVLYSKFGMSQQNPDMPLTHPDVILSTDDLTTTHQALQAKGVKISEITEMPYGKMCTFKDQDDRDYLLREN